MRLRLVKEPFDHPDYVFELKHDGFRAIAYVQNNECSLVSRNMRSLRFDSLRLTLAKLPVQNAIFDGEIICLDLNGVSQFNWLLNEPRARRATFYAFDLIWLDGMDLRRTPLIEREMRKLVIKDAFNDVRPERTAMQRLKQRIAKVYKLNYVAMKSIMSRPANVVKVKADISNPLPIRKRR